MKGPAQPNRHALPLHPSAVHASLPLQPGSGQTSPLPLVKAFLFSPSSQLQDLSFVTKPAPFPAIAHLCI